MPRVTLCALALAILTLGLAPAGHVWAQELVPLRVEDVSLAVSQPEWRNGRVRFRPDTVAYALYVLARYARLNEEISKLVMPSVERYARYFVQQMSDPETFVTKYPITKILSILRPIFPDPEDDLQYWDYEMYKWVL